jgi:hypothetical protein
MEVAVIVRGKWRRYAGPGINHLGSLTLLFVLMFRGFLEN